MNIFDETKILQRNSTLILLFFPTHITTFKIHRKKEYDLPTDTAYSAGIYLLTVNDRNSEAVVKYVQS